MGELANAHRLYPHMFIRAVYKLSRRNCDRSNEKRWWYGWNMEHEMDPITSFTKKQNKGKYPGKALPGWRNKLAPWQLFLVEWFERDLERKLVREDFKCVDWDSDREAMTIARNPLLAEFHERRKAKSE